MANRRFYQFRLSLEPQVVDLYAHITFGAAGAPTLDAAQSRGIASVTRNSAGNYTIALQDNYNRLLIVKHVFVESTAPAAPGMFVSNDSVVSATAPALTVVFNAAGTATDPATGDQVRLQISLKNSKSTSF